MNSFLIVCLFFTLSVSAIPVDPLDEVELIEPKNTNSRDPETGFVPQRSGFVPQRSGGFPIIIVRTEEGTNPFGGFPFGRRSPFGGFPFHSQFPDEVEEVDPELPVPGIPSILRNIFGIPHTGTSKDDEEVQEEEETPKENCGLICTLIGDLHKIHGMVEDEIKDVHQGQEDAKDENEDTLFETENADGNSTYTEEVLSDGTVIKTNRTVVKNPNGVSFVFTQTTSFNNRNENEEDEDKDDEVIDDEEDIDIRGGDVEDVLDEGDNDAVSVPSLIDEFPNDDDNEIFDDEVGLDEDFDGVDGGLVELEIAQ